MPVRNFLKIHAHDFAAKEHVVHLCAKAVVHRGLFSVSIMLRAGAMAAGVMV